MARLTIEGDSLRDVFEALELMESAPEEADERNVRSALESRRAATRQAAIKDAVALLESIPSAEMEGAAWEVLKRLRAELKAK